MTCRPRREGLSPRRRDWSSPAFFDEGIVVVATVGAVRGGSRAAAQDQQGVAALAAAGVLAPVGRARMIEAHNRGTRGGSGANLGLRGCNGSSWYTGCIGSPALSF